jgi:lipoprotein-anchoring transpeptidase ErfK/SrfK
VRGRLLPWLLVVVVVAVAGCTSPHQRADVDAGPPSTDPPATAPAATTTTVDPHQTVVATVVGPSIDIFDEPGAAKPARTMPSPRPSGQEQVFLVLEDRGDWLSVLLPVRPNGTTGWIRAADVDLSVHDYRILVELDAHLLTVTKGDEIVHQEPVGVGRGRTPTPGGLFYTVELYRSLKPAYGPYAYGLSGYSDVLYDFAGGDGQFGIHGTSDPSGLGHDVSHGCIRMSNAGITELANMLPLGVPVEVVA